MAVKKYRKENRRELRARIQSGWTYLFATGGTRGFITKENVKDSRGRKYKVIFGNDKTRTFAGHQIGPMLVRV
jgi:hypothetical protein